MEIGTFKHAFRDEMSEVMHWSLFLATALIVGLQISQAGAYEVAPVNVVYTYLFNV